MKFGFHYIWLVLLYELLYRVDYQKWKISLVSLTHEVKNHFIERLTFYSISIIITFWLYCCFYFTLLKFLKIVLNLVEPRFWFGLPTEYMQNFFMFLKRYFCISKIIHAIFRKMLYNIHIVMCCSYRSFQACYFTVWHQIYKFFFNLWLVI